MPFDGCHRRVRNPPASAPAVRQTAGMAIDEESAYRAVRSRDRRFDGMFYTGVRTTGIYCRPSCSARTPHRRNVGFYASAAAAQRAGFRACKLCRPDATPGSAEWNVRADLAGRASRLICDGVLDRDGVAGLARRLGYSERQVSRAVVSELGAPPLALARAQRAQTARILLETSSLPASDVAFAAGFASVRQFNDTIREVFDATPTGLRAHRQGRAANAPAAGLLDLRLPYRVPMTLATTLAFLARRAIPGVEDFDGTTYTRTVPLPHGPGLIAVTERSTACCADGQRPGGTPHVHARLRLTDHRDLAAAVARTRRLLDLDADPVAVDEVLRSDPTVRPLALAFPGLRSPGAVDGFEMAVRAVVGQQVSIAAARTVLGRIAADHGSPAFDGEPGWLSFPHPSVLAEADPVRLPMPVARGRTIVSLAARMAGGELVLDAGADRDAARAALLELRGIGPWTAEYLQMRATGDPDVFLASDLGVRHALTALGGEPAESASAFAPWRSYLTHQLWASLPAPPGAARRTYSSPTARSAKDIR